MIPSGLAYGANYLVEFEPQSLWYETSLTLVSDSLKRGIKTDYHIFQHIPSEVRGALSGLGVDVKKLEEGETLRIIDSYTVTTGLEPAEEESEKRNRFFEGRSLSLTDWTKELIADMKGEIAGERKGRLHVDDNVSIVVQYNDEKSFIDFWRTKIIPETRKLEFAALHGVVKGAYSDAFYRQFESISDGIIDFKSQEEGGRMEQYVRVRWIRGKICDSRWRRLRLDENGRISIDASVHPFHDLGIKSWIKGVKP